MIQVLFQLKVFSNLKSKSSAILLFILLFTFKTFASDGKQFLDDKRGWKDFYLGQSLDSLGHKAKYLGLNEYNIFEYQAIFHPDYFASSKVEDITLVSKDSVFVIGVYITLGVVCSADFTTNTDFKNVVAKLNKVFGKFSSTDHNPSLGEYSFYWLAEKTACCFKTIWDADKRHYTGQIIFYPLKTAEEERSDF